MCARLLPMLIRQINNALTLTGSIIAFVKYFTYMCIVLVIEKDRQSEPVSRVNNFVFSAFEYDEASDVLNDLGYTVLNH